MSLQAVQEVISNLMISHIELRTEQSPDIQPYTHERKVEKVVVPLGEELSAVKEKYLQVTRIWATNTCSWLCTMSELESWNLVI